MIFLMYTAWPEEPAQDRQMNDVKIDEPHFRDKAIKPGAMLNWRNTRGLTFTHLPCRIRIPCLLRAKLQTVYNSGSSGTLPSNMVTHPWRVFASLSESQLPDCAGGLSPGKERHFCYSDCMRVHPFFNGKMLSFSLVSFKYLIRVTIVTRILYLKHSSTASPVKCLSLDKQCILLHESILK